MPVEIINNSAIFDSCLHIRPGKSVFGPHLKRRLSMLELEIYDF